MYTLKKLNQIIVLYILCICIFIRQGIAQVPKKLTTRIISSYPSPGPSPQGLAWDGKNLWVADDSTNLIYKVNPSTGETILSFASPSLEARGLALDGHHLILSESQNSKIYILETSGKELGEVISLFDTHIKIDNKKLKKGIRGLTWDGKFLYFVIEAGWSSRIVKLNPTNKEMTTVTYTAGFPRGLAWDGEYVWNIIANTTEGSKYKTKGNIIKYDSVSGQKKGSIHIPFYFPTGLTFDGEYFWVTDEKERKIYKILVR